MSKVGGSRVPGTPRIFPEAETHGHWGPATTSPDTRQRVGALGDTGSGAGRGPVPAALSHLSGGRAGAGRRENSRRRERLSSRWLLWDRRSVPRSSYRPSAPSAAKPSPQSRERKAAAPPPSALPPRASHAPSRRPSSPLLLPSLPPGSCSLPVASGPCSFDLLLPWGLSPQGGGGRVGLCRPLLTLEPFHLSTSPL